jgi:hypothetical protein
MFAGQSVIVANVVLTIFHDPDEPNFSLGNSLHVRINPIDGYLLEDVRVLVSADVVALKHPAPGQFPFQLDPNELGAFDALIPLTDIAPPNTQLYVAIHAEACSGLPWARAVAVLRQLAVRRRMRREDMDDVLVRGVADDGLLLGPRHAWALLQRQRYQCNNGKKHW